MDTLLRILCCINARDVWLLLIRVSSNTLQEVLLSIHKCKLHA